MIPQPAVKFITRRSVVGEEDWQCHTTAGRLTVLKGFTSDGASIPSPFWWIPGFLPFEGDTFGPAYGHDALFAGELCDRATADRVLYEMLKQNGVGEWRAQAFYRAVRLAGWNVWRKHTRESIAKARRFVSLEPLTRPAK